MTPELATVLREHKLASSYSKDIEFVFSTQRFAGHAKPSITLDIYVGEFEALKSNDIGMRLSAAFAGII